MPFLYEQINTAKLFIPPQEVPQFVIDNLSKNIVLRDYQKQAFSDTLIYLNTPNLSGNKQTHLLYHMATGSGKTVIMAMNILYYYSLGYRNFLFFTNQSSIVNKTKINFTDSSSSKFLFNESLSIDGKNININVVTSFQNTNDEDINICFDTVQGIHSELFFVKENSLTIEDFSNKKVVLIADEAHHLNSLTSRADKALLQDETTWENTIFNIFRANKDNVLLEFTATCNLRDANILNKYTDKIVFNFPLKEFREAGYTKEFSNFSTDTSKWVRTLQALIMSEYRKLMFDKNKVISKPVVMLKSYRIQNSKDFYKEFYTKLSSLSGSELLEIKNRNSSSKDAKYMNNAFAFFDENNISLDSLASMIKIDFAEEHAVMMNGESSDSDDLYTKVNTLDDRNNPYRLIFTVAKLSEGWDVLCLYDIVRLFDERQGGTHGQPSDFTISEAQLIGRGARYFPFKFHDDQIADKKKYTNNLDNPESICETLLYHSMNDNRYITELKLALIKTGFEPEKKVEVEYRLKQSFKNTDIYSDGFIFVNKRIEKDRRAVSCLPDSIRTKNFGYRCQSGLIKTNQLFNERDNKQERIIEIPPIKLKDVPLNISYKAYRCFHSTLNFSSLKSKFPNLKSQEEFITSDSYLGNITITLTSYGLYKPTNGDLLEACKRVFNFISEFVQKIEITFEGTKEFFAKKISEVIPTSRIRQISEDRVVSDAWGEGVSQNDYRVPEDYRVDLSNSDWYAFDDNKGTSEEKKFVSYFNTIVAQLKKKYDYVYLIRNELFFSLFSFNTGDKFEPDYVLVLKKDDDDMNTYLCVFIEPKGTHLLQQDKWKGDFMLEMESSAIPVVKFVDDNEYKIWGTPLFNEENTKNEFISYVYGKNIF